MSDKLVLIDGNSIINRAFFGVPVLTNSEGIYTNAIYGFLNILFKILDEEKADYLCIAFDLKAPTFRHKMYDAYKGTRKGMPEELKEQVPILKDLLGKMNLCMVQMEGYEADDLLGTLAKRAEREGMAVSLVSGDRDLLQIATDNIKIRIPKTKSGKTEIEDYYTKDVLEKYKLTPLQIIELKALMGDSSDNIPGVPKIGEKTATELLLKYENIENLKEHLDEITKNSVRNTLTEHFDMAELSKKLATICTEAPVDVDFSEMSIKNMYTCEAYELLKKLELKQLLKRFDKKMDVEGEKLHDSIKIDDINGFSSLLNDLKLKKQVAFFIDYTDKKGMTIATGEEELAFVECAGFLTFESMCSEFSKLILESLDTMFITCNLKEQLLFLDSSIDIFMAHKFSDVGIAAYLINPLMKDYSIMAPLENMAYEIYVRYMEHIQKLKDMDMLKLYYEIEMPLVFCLYDMETEGIGVNPLFLKDYGNKLDEEIKALSDSIHQVAGDDFNINSPKQLGELLFEKMAIPGGKKTKTGYSTSADILEKLAPDYPFVADILKIRGLTKLKSTYIDGLFPCIGADSRIHSTFNQTITATGRISSTEPNLQNIPVRMEQGRLIRKAFVPKENYVFISADYSQVELRIMAHMSDDEKLIAAYNSDADIHRITASEVFHVPFDEVTSTQRSNAKAVNFGIIYGISSFGLSQDLSISVKEAKSYINKYFETYPKVKDFIDSLVSGAKSNGYATTLWGRKRPIPELASGNFMQRSFGERVAMNAPIQGTAADIIKIAMINVNRRIKEQNLKSRLILQVHDELIIEAHMDEEDIIKKLLKEEMEKVADFKVKLIVSVSEGKDWYEAK